MSEEWDDAVLQDECKRLQRHIASSSSVRRRNHQVGKTNRQETKTKVLEPMKSNASSSRPIVKKRPSSIKLRNLINPLPKQDGDHGTSASESQVPTWLKINMSGFGQQFTVGTECSGLETVTVALHKMGLKSRMRLLFCTEVDKHAQRMINTYAKPDWLYDDITKRCVKEMPRVDLYAAGFPCQPFSGAGLNEGTNDRHGRGNIFPHILEYINLKLPKSFVLENVKGLTYTTHRTTFRNIMEKLRESGAYIVMWKTLNTCDFGLPQFRPRVFIVGLLKKLVNVKMDTPCFHWPLADPDSCVPLSTILQKGLANTIPRTGSRVQKNIKSLTKTIRAKKINVKCTPCVLDVGAGSSRTRYMLDLVPRALARAVEDIG